MTQRGGLQCKAARNGVWVPRATSRRGEGGATQLGLDVPPTSHAPSRQWLYSPGAGARRGTAGARWSGAARPESGGPGRRPERGGPGRRGQSTAARGGALSAVAPRGDLVLRPLPWLLASWPRGGTAPAALAPGYWRRPSLGWRRLRRKPGGREKQRERRAVGNESI